MKIYEFDAVIVKHETINAGYIEFPYDVEIEFGTKGQVKINATFDGHEYRGSLAKMGTSCHILGLTQEVRKAIGKEPGDIVHVVLKKDDRPRTAEVPRDLAEALSAAADAREFFESLSYTKRKEIITWITDAKREETRTKRVKEAINLLSHKQARA